MIDINSIEVTCVVIIVATVEVDIKFVVAFIVIFISGSNVAILTFKKSTLMVTLIDDVIKIKQQNVSLCGYINAFIFLNLI